VLCTSLIDHRREPGQENVLQHVRASRIQCRPHLGPRRHAHWRMSTRTETAPTVEHRSRKSMRVSDAKSNVALHVRRGGIGAEQLHAAAACCAPASRPTSAPDRALPVRFRRARFALLVGKRRGPSQALGRSSSSGPGPGQPPCPRLGLPARFGRWEDRRAEGAARRWGIHRALPRESAAVRAMLGDRRRSTSTAPGPGAYGLAESPRREAAGSTGVRHRPGPRDGTTGPAIRADQLSRTCLRVREITTVRIAGGITYPDKVEDQRPARRSSGLEREGGRCSTDIVKRPPAEEGRVVEKYAPAPHHPSAK